MKLTCYLRKGIVYIPTLGMIERGFYRYIEPVVVAQVSDREGLRKAILDTIARGNPLVPRIIGGDYGQHPMLKPAGLKSWSAFAKGAMPVSATEQDGIYKIVGQRKRPDRGWHDDPEQIHILPAGSTVDDLCDRLIEFLQTLAAKS